VLVLLASYEGERPWKTHLVQSDIFKNWASRGHRLRWRSVHLSHVFCCSVIRHMDAAANFRSQSLYNNVIYSLAGHVVEQLAGGKRWEHMLRRLILDPLNMTQTSFYDARDDPDRFARPYLHPNGVASAWTQPTSLT